MDHSCKVCGCHCSPGECYYPLQIDIKRDVPIAYSKVSKELFELNFLGETTLSVLNPTNHTFLEENTIEMFNTAVGGLFTIKKGSTGHKVVFEGISMKYLNVIVAVLKQGFWKLEFRVFTGVNQIFCAPFNEMHTLGFGKVPEKFTMNTALIVCVKSNMLNINVKLLGDDVGVIHWTPESFIVPEKLNINNEIAFQRIDPNYAQRCPECLVVSPLGHGHINPCPPVKTISCLRDSIYSSTMTRVFQIRFEEPNYSVQVLNNDVNRFVEVTPGIKLINDIVDGIFTFKTINVGKKIMTFEATAMKRFSIIFAFWNKNAWRIRLRLVITTSYGVLAFPITKTLFIENGHIAVPEEYKTNTAVFVGLHSPDTDIRLSLRIFANASGIINQSKFNGYEAQIEWNRSDDQVRPSENLLVREAKKRSFDRRLYRANGIHQIVGDLFQQRFAPEPPIMPNLTPSEPVAKMNTITHDDTDQENNDDWYNAFQFWHIEPVSIIEPNLESNTFVIDPITNDDRIDTDQENNDDWYNAFQFWYIEPVSIIEPVLESNTDDTSGKSTESVTSNNENEYEADMESSESSLKGMTMAEWLAKVITPYSQ